MKLKLIATMTAAVILAGCSSVDLMAPIDDRSGTFASRTGTEATSVALGEEKTRHLVTEREARASGATHVVVKGDTIYNISRRYGLNPRELMALNGITDPTMLSLGLELKLPTRAESLVKDEPLGTKASSEAMPMTALPKENTVTVEVAKKPDTPEAAAARELEAQRIAREAASRGEVELMWPARGDVIASFRENKMGIDISGNAGDPVFAVLDGTVSYVGSNVPGYGQFVIIRHNIQLEGKANVPLQTVYANNSKILVRKNESVRTGQQIAEMGKTDSDIVKLHFEIRQGKPLDPIDYLKKK